jgi:hypothetical protein
VTLNNGEGKGDGEERGKSKGGEEVAASVLCKKEAGLGPEPDSGLSPPDHKGLLG